VCFPPLAGYRLPISKHTGILTHFQTKVNKKNDQKSTFFGHPALLAQPGFQIVGFVLRISYLFSLSASRSTPKIEFFAIITTIYSKIYLTLLQFKEDSDIIAKSKA